jgi:hypothetical protein
MYRSIFEIWILFFLRNKVVFPSSHPFPTAVGANLVCLQPKPLPRFSGKVTPHGKRAQAHTVRSCNPLHACSLSAKPTFFQKSCPLRILRMAQDSPPKTDLFS